MRGACRSFAPVNVLLLVAFVACGSDRGTGAAPATSDTAVAARDTTTAGTSDSGSSARRDSAPAPSMPAPRKPAAPAPKPAAPAPKPAAPAPASDTPLETPAAGAAPAQTQADAPLRDQYHQAPLDTVTQEVYDGWKQFNLLCSRCHGEDVMGTTIAPHLVVSLKPNGPINTKELFVTTVCAGRPEKGMPGWCPLGLEMSKIEAIYVYVKGRSEGKVHPGRPAVKSEGS